MSKRLILCDCDGSQTVDDKTIEATCGITCSNVYTALCTNQIEQAAAEIGQGDAIVACLQERAVFEEIAEEIDVPVAGFIDVRDRAGWTEAGAKTGPKMAALVSDALLDIPAAKIVDILTEGRCLVLGSAQTTLEVAGQLSDSLPVTVLLDTAIDLPIDRSFDVVVGELKSCNGTLGKFTVGIDRFSQLVPGGRGAFELTEARDGAQSECDIILDFRGDSTLFAAPQKRDGYLRADPGDPRAVAAAVFEAAQYVGTFEKPIYLSVEEHLCAHSRAQKTGCSKCIDVCPTGAVVPDGDHISVDRLVCAGCSACVALCPSGAITYDAPPTSAQFRRIENLASTYLRAGGKAPRLLVCDTQFGPEMVALAARFDRGMPADVIPMEVAAIEGFGHAEMLAALAVGFVHVDILLTPETTVETLDSECVLAKAISGSDRVRLLDIKDPTALCDTLYSQVIEPLNIELILPQGSRRQIARLAALALTDKVDVPLQLPVDAPYGAVVVDGDACTLCMACASLCPTGALGDNPDTPELRFQEDACLQCGLCTRVCPEKAITLLPRFDLSEQALTQQVMYEEDPFACIECGALFGVKSMVEKVSEKLVGKHWMYTDSKAGRLIQMCENCRVKVQYENTDNPFQGGERPKTVTTDDYLSKRRDH